MSDNVLEQVKIETVHLLDESVMKLEHCLSQLSETEVWFRPESAVNSIGNLLLHQSGNLRQWIVCGVGGASDRRDRATEFAPDQSATKVELLTTVATVVREATHAIGAMTPDVATQSRCIQGFDVTGLGAVLHSVPHFVGHTHQVIYITRLQLGASYKFAWSPDSGRSGVPI